MKNEIKKLVATLNEYPDDNSKHDVIASWLKTRSPEPLVVGLSDEQVADLCVDIHDTLLEDDSCVEYTSKVIKRWLKAQTFAQPEPFQPSWDSAPSWANWLAQDDAGVWCWFENEPEMKLSGGIWDVKGKNQRISYVKNWKQTLQERQSKLHKTVRMATHYQKPSLERKGSFAKYPRVEAVADEVSKFEVDWSTAPELAEHYQVQGVFYSASLGKLTSTELYSEQRPKPTPIVEVGQVWENGNEQQSEVIAVNDKQVVRACKSGGFMINNMKDFLASHTKVQP